MQGRADARLRLTQRIAAEVDKWSAPLLLHLAQHKAALIGELRSAVNPEPPKDPSWAAAEMLLGMEVRRNAERLSDAGLELLFRQGGAAVRRAMLSMPRITTRGGLPQIRPYVSAELQEEVLLAEGAAKKPETARMVEDIDRTAGAHKACVNALRGALKQIADAATADLRAYANPRSDDAPFRDPGTGEELEPPAGRPS